MKLFITFLLLTIAFQASYAQKFMIVDSNPKGDGGYFQLSNYVRLSLQKGQQYPQLVFSDGSALTEKQFLALARKFQSALPSDFFEIGTNGIFGLSSTHPLATNTTECAFGIIEQGKVRLFVQIFIRFDGTQTESKIKAIEVRTGNEIVQEDPKALIKKYNERLEEEKKIPALPPPIQN